MLCTSPAQAASPKLSPANKTLAWRLRTQISRFWVEGARFKIVLMMLPHVGHLRAHSCGEILKGIHCRRGLVGGLATLAFIEQNRQLDNGAQDHVSLLPEGLMREALQV